jgi:hypothetical protein
MVEPETGAIRPPGAEDESRLSEGYRSESVWELEAFGSLSMGPGRIKAV